MEDNEKNILFICSCGDVEHQLIMSYWEDDINPDDCPEVYAAVHLNPERKWWQRIWAAVRYIFGRCCKYGHFDEFIFKPKDYVKLQNVVDYLKKCHEVELAKIEKAKAEKEKTDE